jgi:hypothetical protein
MTIKAIAMGFRSERVLGGRLFNLRKPITVMLSSVAFIVLKKELFSFQPLTISIPSQLSLATACGLDALGNRVLRCRT